VYSSCGSENEDIIKKNKKKKEINTRTIDKSNDRNTEGVSATPTNNSLNNNIQKKLTQDKSDKNEKSNDKSNNSKSADKTSTIMRDNMIMAKLKSKSK
jgi:hypothetical protein